MRISWKVLFILSAMTAALGSGNASADAVFGYQLETDVPYGKGLVVKDGALTHRPLLLDVYSPVNVSAEVASPVVILVHGGGFQRGGLRNPPYKEQGAVHGRMEDYARLLAPLGYVVFVIEYRLAPELPEPETALDADWLLPMSEDLTEAGMRRVNFARASLDLPPLEGDAGKTVVWKTILSAAEDLFKAVEYVQSSAGRYNVDPTKIAVGGHSAGAATAINAVFGLNAPVAAMFPLSPPVSAIDVTRVVTSDFVTPTMIVMSQNDEPAVMEKVPVITEAMRNAGANFELVWVPGFPHFYPTGAVSLGDDGIRLSVGDRVIQFLGEHLQ
ncbi:MAG: alpha/beta hydrolase [Halioglobus sp.]